MTVAILTVSDSAVAGTREDLSGPLLRERCSELGWNVIASQVLPDEPEAISQCLSGWADGGVAELILTTGGTGIAARDVTPEATRAVIDREIQGFGELMRSQGLQQTPLSPLSRALAGSRGSTLILNLPGSPKGAVFSLNVVSNLIPHCVRLLNGQTAHRD
jgi:molybdopterin adenylyltransferase